MGFNIEKVAAIAKPRNEKAIKAARFRQENREWLRMSQEIALCLSHHLRRSSLTQKSLAEQLGVSPAYVVKLLKGNENLTLETICKIQKVTGHDIVMVAKPYIVRTTVTFTPLKSVGSDAISIKKFSKHQIEMTDFFPIDGIDAA